MNDTMFSQDQKTPCPAISENIYQILIAYNRQTARGFDGVRYAKLKEQLFLK